jgi:hypothetical protein
MVATLGLLLLAGCKGEDCEPSPTVPVGTRFRVHVLGPIEPAAGAAVADCNWLDLSEGFVVESGSIRTYKRPDTSECAIQDIAGAPEEFPSDYPIGDCAVGPGYYVDCRFSVPECPQDGVGILTMRLGVPTQSDSAETEVHISGGIRCQGTLDSCAEGYRILVTRIDE